MSTNGYVSSSDDEWEHLSESKSDEELEDPKPHLGYFVVPITSGKYYEKFMLDQVREISKFDTHNIIYRKELLVVAIENNESVAVQRILENGVNVEEARDKNGEPPIVQAAAKGYVEILKILLEKGANVNSVTKNNRRRKHKYFNGRTALMAAARHGHLNILEILLQCRNIDVNVIDRSGRNVLFYACKKPDLKIIKKLVECGVKLQAYILGYIIRKRISENKKLEIIKFLIFNGADYEMLVFENIRSPNLRKNIKEICVEYEQIARKEFCDGAHLIPDINNIILEQYLNFKKVKNNQKYEFSNSCVIL